MKVNPNISKFLFGVEGNASKVTNKAFKVKETSSDWGEYLDPKGFSTTGIGMLVSTNPRGSEEYTKDRTRFEKTWSKRLGKDININNLDEETSYEMKNRYIEEKLKDPKVLGGVDINTLPEGVQTAVVSLLFNHKAIGPNTLRKLQDFDHRRDSDSLNSLANAVEKYNIKSPKDYEMLKGRRKQEADLIRSVDLDVIQSPEQDLENPEITSIKPQEVESSPKYASTEDNPNSFPTNKEKQLNLGSQISNDPNDPNFKTIKEKKLDLGEQLIGGPNIDDGTEGLDGMEQTVQPKEREVYLSDVAPNTFPVSIKEQMDAQRELLKKYEGTDYVDSIKKWGSHTFNSLMTENIVGQQASKLLLSNNEIGPVDPMFEPTKSQTYKSAQEFVDPEHMVDLVKDSINEADLSNRVSLYMAEKDTRQEVGEYMSVNPVGGFAGIGLASMADVTSLIPVGKLASIGKLSKLTNGVSKATRMVGGAILENLVQDLTQEVILTSNSDIRRFEDGDILWGAAAGAVMGGLVGAAGFKSAEKGFIKLTHKYSNEKNLVMLERSILRAKQANYPASTLSKLELVRTKLIQDLDKDMKVNLLGLRELYSEKFKPVYLNNKKIDLTLKQADYVRNVDEQISLLKNESKQKIIDVKKVNSEELRKLKEANSKPMESLTNRIKGLNNKIKSMKNHDTEASITKISNIKKEIKVMESKVADLNNQTKKLAKTHAKTLDKVVKEAKKLELDNNTSTKIALLNASKKTHLNMLGEDFQKLSNSLDNGEGIPVSSDWNIEGFNDFIKELGVQKEFKSIDELDEFLGLKFKDTVALEVGSKNQNMGAAKRTKEYVKNASQVDFIQEGINLKELNPDYSVNFIATDKNSIIGNMMRRTKLHEYLNETSWWGRLGMSMNSLKNSDNPYAAGLANRIMSTKGGRVTGSELAIEEVTAKYRNIYAGSLKKEINSMIYDLKPEIKTNKALQETLGLQGNTADLFKIGGADFESTVSGLVRKELLDNGVTERLYGKNVADVVNRFIDNKHTLEKSLVERAKAVGVKDADHIIPDRNYLHRSWDNHAARSFVNDYGQDALVDLVEKGLIDAMRKSMGSDFPAELTEELASKIYKEAKEFAFGITNVDLRLSQKSNDSFSDFLSRIENGNWDGIIDLDKFKEKAGKEVAQLDAAKKKALARRKQLDLTSSVLINVKGKEESFSLSDLLEPNLIESQNDFFNSLIPRIAFAEKGIKDIGEVDDMIMAAAKYSADNGDKAAAEYIQESFGKVMMGLRSGGVGPTDVDEGARKALSFVKKYNYARLMQYTGISSIAELGMTVTEAGYKATYEAASHSIDHWFRTRKLSGATAAELSDELTETLSAITGVGLEGFNFAASRSSKGKIYKEGVMSSVEKGIDNIGRVTHGSTSWIETFNRKLTNNAIALNMSNVMLGRSSTNGYTGGLSNFNLSSLGLAKKLDNGGYEMTPLFNNIQRNIKNNAVDIDGNLASVSGKRIVAFKFDKWETGMSKQFGDVLTQRTNHILVNPDVSTQALWNTTLVGSIINQFKSFSQAAHSKVAMHNLNASVEAIKNREMAEIYKGAHKLFLGAMFGKVSLMAYSAIHNIGRDDYEERMAEAMSVNDYRDWTKALGRGSVLTGADTAIDTGIGIVNAFNDKNHQMEGMFNSSTIGQSRNMLDIGSTATGQLVLGTAKVGEELAQGNYTKARDKAINLTPIRRTIGINQLLNSMGVK